jgi:hypothetical protein
MIVDEAGKLFGGRKSIPPERLLLSADKLVWHPTAFTKNHSSCGYADLQRRRGSGTESSGR